MPIYGFYTYINVKMSINFNNERKYNDIADYGCNIIYKPDKLSDNLKIIDTKLFAE